MALMYPWIKSDSYPLHRTLCYTEKIDIKFVGHQMSHKGSPLKMIGNMPQL